MAIRVLSKPFSPFWSPNLVIKKAILKKGDLFRPWLLGILAFIWAVMISNGDTSKSWLCFWVRVSRVTLVTVYT